MLLFGGPGPGGMAMSEYPRLCLEAFCQTLLVLEDEQGAVMLHFNDIVALAELHYGSSNKPQAVINQRLLAMVTGAVAGEEEAPRISRSQKLRSGRALSGWRVSPERFGRPFA